MSSEPNNFQQQNYGHFTQLISSEALYSCKGKNTATLLCGQLAIHGNLRMKPLCSETAHSEQGPVVCHGTLSC